MANFYAASVLAILLIIIIPNYQSCDTVLTCNGQSTTYDVGNCDTDSVSGTSYSVQAYCKNGESWYKSYLSGGCSGSVYQDISLQETADAAGCSIDDCCAETPTPQPTPSPIDSGSNPSNPSSSSSSSSGSGQVKMWFHQILFNTIATFALYAIVY